MSAPHCLAAILAVPVCLAAWYVLGRVLDEKQRQKKIELKNRGMK